MELVDLFASNPEAFTTEDLIELHNWVVLDAEGTDFIALIGRVDWERCDLQQMSLVGAYVVEAMFDLIDSSLLQELIEAVDRSDRRSVLKHLIAPTSLSGAALEQFDSWIATDSA